MNQAISGSNGPFSGTNVRDASFVAFSAQFVLAAILILVAAPASATEEGKASAREEFLAQCEQMKASDLPFYGRNRLKTLEKQLLETADPVAKLAVEADLGEALLLLDEIEPAIAQLSDTWMRARESGVAKDLEARALSPLVLSHLQAAEDANCVLHRSASSCILPLQPEAIHREREHAARAGDLALELLKLKPRNFEVGWVFNLARMLSGDFPNGVPEQVRLPPASLAPEVDGFTPWIDRSRELGIDDVDLAGGAIVDDFDGDGLLDIVTSTWDPCDHIKAYRNDGEGGFEDLSKAWGLDEQLGAFNLLQADYDNDGDLDLLALRGGWLFSEGRIRNSLLRNDASSAEAGESTRRFVDVTLASGLAEPAYPTQTGAWADYDNDGDLDLYVGNEHSGERAYPSQLFRNRGDGTFEDVAEAAGVANHRFTKGVGWGDYDNDGDADLYVSNQGLNRLYRNDGNGRFEDVAAQLGVAGPDGWTFATWFFDPDNDGDLDLFVGDYRSSTEAVAASYFGVRVDEGHPFLFLNEGGRFRDVSAEWGLRRPALPMGANFGDLDNDGWLDVYLGTGEPSFQSQVPNLMYRNLDGRTFQEVTFAGGFGHLQKGHGVAFGDLDNDGDQDLVHQLGGFYPADSFANVVFINPGSQNAFLNPRARGATGKPLCSRSTHRGQGSHRKRPAIGLPPGLFGRLVGGSSLRQEIGLGKATALEAVRVVWPGSQTPQLVTGIELNGAYRVVQSEKNPNDSPEGAGTSTRAIRLPVTRIEFP